jgi:hypothetical protein
MSLLKFLSSSARDAETSSPFAEFIRSAPAAEKKKLYSQVLREASDSQNELIDRAKAARPTRINP